jgi:hypothetical protein
VSSVLDQPKPFTAAQRELFGPDGVVAKLNRERTKDFVEADEWIRRGPPTAVNDAKRYHREVLAEIRGRRKRTARRRVVTDFGDRVLLFGGKDPSYGLVPHDSLWEHRWWRAYQQMPNHPAVQRSLWNERDTRAKNIKYGRESHREWMREEREHGPLKPSELLEVAARDLLGDNRPLFDGLNPKLKALWARRVLRVTWIMTDTRQLVGPDWLGEWAWGDDPYEFLVEDGLALPIPRIYLRTETFDKDLDEWEQLTRYAVRALQEIGDDAALGRLPALATPEVPPTPPDVHVHVPPIDLSPITAAIKAAADSHSKVDGISQQELADVTSINSGTIARAVQGKKIVLTLDGSLERKSAFAWAKAYCRKNPRTSKPKKSWADYVRSDESDEDVQVLMEKVEAEAEERSRRAVGLRARKISDKNPR